MDGETSLWIWADTLIGSLGQQGPRQVVGMPHNSLSLWKFNDLSSPPKWGAPSTGDGVIRSCDGDAPCETYYWPINGVREKQGNRVAIACMEVSYTGFLNVTSTTLVVLDNPLLLNRSTYTRHELQLGKSIMWTLGTARSGTFLYVLGLL